MRRGLGLAEVVLAIALISLSSVPVFYLFSTSRRMQGSAKYLALAISEANSMHAAITASGKTGVLPTLIEMTSDENLMGELSLSELGLLPLKPPLWRKLSLSPMVESTSILKVEIEVGWDRHNEDSSRYRLMGFIRTK
ncbi:MAG: hypothetical protein H3C47_03320 [Candidatus Cloacimonetes bacterium]|nr:hypothetical protein [Candidatus Cloacimonadota bacterium]